MTTKDYYQILGVTRTETSGGIRSAYRELALRYHPDRAGERGTRFFQEINEAYRTLSDSVSRASYDQGLDHAQERSAFVRPPFRPMSPTRDHAEPLVPEPLSLMHDFVARTPSVDDIFDRIRRNFTDEWRPKSRRLDALKIRIDISPDEAVRGGVVSFGIPVFYPCPSCHGTGRQWHYSCPACAESGMLEEQQQIELMIPGGVRDGAEYFLPLKGLGIHNLALQILVRVR